LRDLVIGEAERRERHYLTLPMTTISRSLGLTGQAASIGSSTTSDVPLPAGLARSNVPPNRRRARAGRSQGPSGASGRLSSVSKSSSARSTRVGRCHAAIIDHTPPQVTVAETAIAPNIVGWTEQPSARSRCAVQAPGTSATASTGPGSRRSARLSPLVR
jgi:hypothetical protein